MKAASAGKAVDRPAASTPNQRASVAPNCSSEVLGINASTLYRKLLGYGLDRGEQADGTGSSEAPDAHAA